MTCRSSRRDAEDYDGREPGILDGWARMFFLSCGGGQASKIGGVGYDDDAQAACRAPLGEADEAEELHVDPRERRILLGYLDVIYVQIPF